MPTILRAYRLNSTSGKLELALVLNLMGNKVEATPPTDPPGKRFDRIVLFPVNEASETPLLILDPLSEDGIHQIRFSKDSVEINAMVRCFARSQDHAGVRLEVDLKASGGKLLYERFEAVCPTPLSRRSTRLMELDGKLIEDLRDKSLTILQESGSPGFARAIGWAPVDVPPNSEPADMRGELKISFPKKPSLDASGKPVNLGTISLTFERLFSVSRRDHRLVSPAPSSRRSACEIEKIEKGNEKEKKEMERLDDTVITVCKQRVKELELNIEAKASLSVLQRQSLTRNVSTYDQLPLGQWAVTLNGFPHSSILQVWNNAFARPYLNALHLVQDGRPVSFMPMWELNTDADKASPRWSMVATVCDSFKQVDLDPESFFFHDDQCLAGKVAVKARALYPDRPQFVATAKFPGFLLQTGDPLQASVRITSKAYKAVTKETNETVFNLDEQAVESNSLPFWFETEHLPAKQGQQISRVGALDLTFPAATSDTADPDSQLKADSEIKVCFRNAAKGDDYKTDLLTVKLKGRLAVFDIAPGGQDDLPGEEFVPDDVQGSCSTNALSREEREIEKRFQRRRPLIIPFPAILANALAKKAGPAEPLIGAERKADFILDYEERTEAARSQTLSMRLIESPSGAAASQARNRQRLIVLDTQPFLVSLVEAPPFAGLADKDGIREIGNWSGTSDEGANWELIGSTDGFSIFLPPQGIGEAMEKWTRVGADEDVAVGKPIDFRFTPLAKFNLSPSYFKQRFAEAPWNLRRILGFPGQRAPGAGVLNMRFEMFYGLACNVAYPFLRLAEIESKLGRIPGRLDSDMKWNGSSAQKEEYRKFRIRWSQLYQRYLSRLSVLEAWDTNQPENLIVSTGINYEIRKTAKLRYPISTDKVPVNDSRRKTPPHAPDGLAGGVSWGFESANVYDNLLKSPKSVEGSALTNPFFSSLGGWGKQKAVFDNGLTTVYANVSMGRTYFYSIERLGRIGVLWNLAKHVIIYERTVAPTRQFADKQNPHLGRPLLRKVREFVEILQPARQYPEFGAAPVTRGFVTGSEFKSRIINVDSDWGGDIAKVGMQIPLWNPQASQQKPDVYPKPQIVLQVAADAGGSNSNLNVEHEEPEKLVFFTLTAGTPSKNTDEWPAIPGIDFPDQPMPVRPNIPASDPNNLDRPLPDAPAIEPGYERFTYAVAQAARGINLTAERAGESLNAALRNVTMARARAKKIEEFDAGKQTKVKTSLDGLATLNGVGNQVEDLLQQILSKLPQSGKASAETDKELKALFASKPFSDQVKALADNVNKLKTQVGGKLLSNTAVCDLIANATDTAIDQASKRLEGLFATISADLREALERFASDRIKLAAEARRIVADLFNQFNDGFDLLNSGFGQVEREADRAFQLARDFKLQVQNEINDAIAVVGKTTAEQETRLRSELEALQQKLQALLRQLDAGSRGANGKLGKTVEQIRARVLNLGSLVDSKIAELEGKVSQGAAVIKAGLEVLQTSLIAEFAKLESELAQTQAGVKGIFDEAKGKLATLKQQIATLRDAILTDLNQPDLTLAKIKAIVEAQIAAARNEILAGFGIAKVAIRNEICPKLLNFLFDEATQFGTNLVKLLAGEGAAAAEFLTAVKQKLTDAATPGKAKAFSEVRREIEREFERARLALAPFADRAKDILVELADLGDDTLHQVGEQTLRLLRAFGDAPRVPMLNFNRVRLAYFFDELKKHVDLTPVMGLVNRAGDELKAMGIRFPVANLLDRFTPDALKNFKLSDVFPDFAGLKLESLFPGLKFPDFQQLPGSSDGDRVKVMHGIDRQSLRAWLKVTVDVPIVKGDEKATVFAFGPVELKVANAQFTAVSLITVDVGSSPKLKTEGKITGDWELNIAGTQLVTFRDTTLMFDDSGRIRFELSPDKVELAGALKFLADMLAKLLSDGSGFTVRLVEINGRPAGVESILDLPLPDVQFGAFGISGLRMGSLFRVLAISSPNGLDFAMGVGLSFGQKIAPFTLTIFILGGGGWFDTRITYYPLRNHLIADITIGITASATLAFSLGPIKGSVSITFGIYAELHADSQAGTSFSVGIMLLLAGEVRVLSLVSVSISLLLEAQYNSDGSLVGRGTLSVKIKICWCFTFKFSKSVSYTFKNDSLGLQAAAIESFDLAALLADSYDTAAEQYLAMFE